MIKETRNRRKGGALHYTRGSGTRGHCTNCMDFPFFQRCVSLSGTFDGVCASCHAKNIGSTCSLREQNGESCFVVVDVMLTYSLGTTGFNVSDSMNTKQVPTTPLRNKNGIHAPKVSAIQGRTRDTPNPRDLK